jgi:hypothetical protein
VYSPLVVIVPPDAVHVAAVLLVPDMIAVNCCCPPAWRVGVPGERKLKPEWRWETVIIEEADFLESPALVAVML